MIRASYAFSFNNGYASTISTNVPIDFITIGDLKVDSTFYGAYKSMWELGLQHWLQAPLDFHLLKMAGFCACKLEICGLSLGHKLMLLGNLYTALILLTFL